MLELASHIVETKSGHFEPDKFEDQYEDALEELLKKKQAGEKIEAPKERAPANHRGRFLGAVGRRGRFVNPEWTCLSCCRSTRGLIGAALFWSLDHSRANSWRMPRLGVDCASSRLTSAARFGGGDAASASYWSLNDRPIAASAM
jgi:hypothetical protein